MSNQASSNHPDRYGKMFASLKEQNQGAFVPFVTIGDPDKATSVEIISALHRLLPGR